MSKKIVELKSKKKIELKEMSIDEVDFCNDSAVMKYEDGEISHIGGLSKTRTAWLRRGISGGDFIQSPPKKTRQGSGKHTKYAATSRNSARKRQRGQGK